MALLSLLLYQTHLYHRAGCALAKGTLVARDILIACFEMGTLAISPLLGWRVLLSTKNILPKS